MYRNAKKEAKALNIAPMELDCDVEGAICRQTY